MKLLLFAQCAQWCGRRELELTLERPQRLSSVLASRPELAPALQRRAALRVAVNERFASFEDEVHDHDEVALLPPVSGG